MRRRRGQIGNLIQQNGWWRVRFRLDQTGKSKRKQMSLKVAPVVFDKNGNPKPPSPEGSFERRKLSSTRERTQRSGSTRSF